jgi:PleD family two-component response regulator
MSISLLAVVGSPSVRKIIQLAFPSPEFDILLLTDGKNVTRPFDSFKPDVVFLDMTLKDPNGFEVAEVLRSHPSSRQCPLFLMKSAFGRLEEKRLAGIDYKEIILQPFDSGALALRVRQLFPEDLLETLPEDPVRKNIPPQPGKAVDHTGDLPEKPPLPRSQEKWKEEIKEEILTEIKEWLKKKNTEAGKKTSE